ncbi:type II toxin-antitoxin system RelE family toxin [Stutzerimonas kirkiae]|uniref:Type II toxin-antitoxin system mRNA interferase toxin, RelE/StbE family n=1 Tax=Stutzerimonas kirkiae TaxID=2211392 RepID=A0A4Q9R9I4_9GAMM|nr:type II toxin-antitoxin system RelE/ParE family toxin [Stutzerimonas kirkiae]TBU96838.1 type II toxin-antitoxin system mRNA interferase toxin, RelE/StbE family [Stutzerimonas kirkiae]TBV00565.1 type II toxin-antitoxin system mRNA interferase toxin, RelE/StbE family [Stutzerimonas kirkiae]TBV08425.1 type II toxin-antitoxin system mRNA interferase toxin, RelE/StbE family [Stutzerimonas kirkiae]TBV16701.1 type II toxin-antitoxin system mRNA interferase toxin, RelE/StbE family [Stutzerimonas kir
MPRFTVGFSDKALKEWNKLDSTIRLQFAKKLKERLGLPRIEADRLRGMPDCYKIKLRSAGYRLVYKVVDQRLVVTVIAVGKRERSDVYEEARKRLE